MTIGLIADTHGLVRRDVARVFAGVDLIVHAGDVGGSRVLDALRAIAPVEAVSGNVDDPHDPALAPFRTVPFGRFTIRVSHGHELGSPTPEKLAAAYTSDILVFGHTHRALSVWIGNQLIINPGSAGPRRFRLEPSVALLRLDDQGEPSVELVTVGE